MKLNPGKNATIMLSLAVIVGKEGNSNNLATDREVVPFLARVIIRGVGVRNRTTRRRADSGKEEEEKDFPLPPPISHAALCFTTATEEDKEREETRFLLPPPLRVIV